MTDIGAVRWVLGIDGGGSKSVGLLLREDGCVAGIGFGGPTNLYFTSVEDAQVALRRVAIQAVEAAVNRGFVSNEVSPFPVAVVYLSAPGLREEVAAAALEGILRWQLLRLEDDAPAAFRGALPGEDGVIALAGTGSFGYGRRGDRVAAKGGWGPILGDEGSGYWIAVQALRAVIKSFEGRGPATLLTTLFQETLHYRFETELRRLVYGPSFNRHRLAGLSMLVSQAAAAGDQVAREILAAAGQELAGLAVAVAAELGWKTDDSFAFSLTGGVSRAGVALTEPFLAAFRAHYPAAVWKPPRYTPGVGAGLKALELLGVQITPALLEVLELSLQSIPAPLATLLRWTEWSEDAAASREGESVCERTAGRLVRES